MIPFPRSASAKVGLLILAVCALSYAGAMRTQLGVPATALPPPDADGFVQLFDGKNLAGWEGLPNTWSVKDGAISGYQRKESSLQTFLVRSGLTVKNFELRLRYQFTTNEGNSGIQFRSTMIDPATFRVGGYQADIDALRTYDGSFYDEAGVAGGRGTLSKRGERTTWDRNNQKSTVPLARRDAALAQLIKLGDWNDVTLVARGNHITYSINENIMTELVDGSPEALQAGCLALQLHQGYTMEVKFKDLKVKLLD